MAGGKFYARTPKYANIDPTEYLVEATYFFHCMAQGFALFTLVHVVFMRRSINQLLSDDLKVESVAVF